MWFGVRLKRNYEKVLVSVMKNNHNTDILPPRLLLLADRQKCPRSNPTTKYDLQRTGY